MLVLEAYLDALHMCKIGTNASFHMIPVRMPQ
jgi:hypothetical protein